MHTTAFPPQDVTGAAELRQPLGTFQFAIKLLAGEDAWADRTKRDRILATAERNVTMMGNTLGKLVALSRFTGRR